MFLRASRRLGFNSTLVRFKLSSTIPPTSTPRPFQFHSGSIQTRRMFDYIIEIADVSIPLWFDSNCDRFGPRKLCHMFQFHSGSIQTCRCRSHLLHKISVSIPLWFDSNTSESSGTGAQVPCFNSTLVRFKPGEPCTASCVRCQVSIPLWFDSNPYDAASEQIYNVRFNSTLVRFKLD